ncbi:MAG: DNA polymerase I, partial [Desulfobacterales bacterium]
MNKEKKLYLIDGSAYIYRAFHAIRALSNSKGMPTNAVFGFTRMILKLFETQAPQYAVMLFDAKGPTFRHDIYGSYKANRPPMPADLVVQLPYIKEITKGFNIPMMETPGFEADDLIGTLANMAARDDISVTMITGDKDFLQLVTDKIIVWDPMKDKTHDTDEIRKRFEVEPHQLIDVMGLSGDASDNVPGVPGIGEKTALSLIKQFGSIEKIYQNIDKITKKKLHENLLKYKDQAMMSRTLVTIDTRVPLTFDMEAFRLRSSDTKTLSQLFRELEFRELQMKFPETSDLSGKKYQAILDRRSLTALASRLADAGFFALDTETTSKNPMRAKIVGLSFSFSPDEAFYVPCAHEDSDRLRQVNIDAVLDRLRPVLEDPEIKKIGQNIKYDWIVLARHGIKLAGVIFDTMLASYLINPSKRAHNLNQIALDFLGHRKITYQEVAGKGKTALNFSRVSIEKAVPYACEDADITLLAYYVLEKKLDEIDLTTLLQTVEIPLIPVLMKMEMRGICVDRERLSRLSKSFADQLNALEQMIYEVAGETFNIKSSQQLGYILFEKLNLPVQKKTKKKTGYSTDVDVLTNLASHHELPALVLRHRTLAKLKSTYADALLELIHPETGRIHTSYNQTVTATGRLSSSDPNLQNIPVRTEEGREIRSAFIPKKGWHMVSADYSQIELRILSHYSNDPILIEAFSKDEDIHARTATEIFQVFPSFITPELRRQ